MVEITQDWERANFVYGRELPGIRSGANNPRSFIFAVMFVGESRSNDQIYSRIPGCVDSAFSVGSFLSIEHQRDFGNLCGRIFDGIKDYGVFRDRVDFAQLEKELRLIGGYEGHLREIYGDGYRNGVLQKPEERRLAGVGGAGSNAIEILVDGIGGQK